MKTESRHKQDAAGRAIQMLKDRYADQILEVSLHAGQVFVSVKRERIVDILRELRDDPSTRYNVLMDLCGVDYLNQGMFERFCVVYNLYSMTSHEAFRVKAYIPEDDPSIPSIHELWKAANWAERETYDMYGFNFTGHPDQRRILLPDHYVGYPLRKDYPLRGMGERDAFPRYVPTEDPE